MPASKELRRSVVKCVSSESSIRLFRRRLPEVEASRTNRVPFSQWLLKRGGASASCSSARLGLRTQRRRCQWK
jgi:hypothetical protein